MALTGYAGYEQAEGQKDMARYQADVAEKNADLDEFRAQQAATIGAVQEEQHRAKVRQLAGAQRADFAARGIDLRSGVVQDLVGETYTKGERTEEHTSELQSIMRISYAILCLKKKKKNTLRAYTCCT